MSKLTPRKEYKKDGSVNIKAYTLTLKKTGVENIANFSENDNLEIIYKKNKIEVIKK